MSKQEMNIKDSGVREKMSTGSQRDTQKGKPRPELIPPSTMVKLALHYGNGACKYDKDNWKLGQPLSRFLASAERHLMAFKCGMVDEPHLISCIWNLICIDWTIDAIKCGMADPELDDRPEDQKDGNAMGQLIFDLVNANVAKMNPVEEMKGDTIYIAGQMRGHRYYNFPAFMKAEKTLREGGWDVINPAQIDLDNGLDPYEFPISYDWDKAPEGKLHQIVKRDTLAIIEKCTAIYLLKGWEKSQGAKAEKALAEWLQLDILKEGK